MPKIVVDVPEGYENIGELLKDYVKEITAGVSALANATGSVRGRSPERAARDFARLAAMRNPGGVRRTTRASLKDRAPGSSREWTRCCCRSCSRERCAMDWR